jgi:DNA-binding SARP family transcriptional activator
VDFRILGPLEVADSGRLLVVGPAKERALLALLPLRTNEVVSRDRLIDQLWCAEPPASAVTVLQTYVSHLRTVLPSERLVTRPPGYAITVGADELDLRCFQGLVAQGEAALDAGNARTAADTFREALGLWRGAALADFAYEPFAQPAIRRLEELRLAALERRIDADLALGGHRGAVGELEALVREHPLREGFRGQLMLALYGAGRQAEALEAYQDARRTLVDELGLEPGPALQELEEAILQQDPALGFTSPIRPMQSEPAREPLHSLLVAPESGDCLEALLALADPLARKPPREVILARLVTDAGALTEATRLVSERRATLNDGGLIVRAAAFTSSDPGEDLVRLASEQAVDLLLVDTPGRLLEGVLDRRLEAVLAGLPATSASSSRGPPGSTCIAPCSFPSVAATTTGPRSSSAPGSRALSDARSG